MRIPETNLALLIEILPSPSLLRAPSAASLLGQIRAVFSLVVRCGRGPRDAPALSEFQSVVLGSPRRAVNRPAAAQAGSGTGMEISTFTGGGAGSGTGPAIAPMRDTEPRSRLRMVHRSFEMMGELLHLE
jgi:hypothetical protein